MNPRRSLLLFKCWLLPGVLALGLSTGCGHVIGEKRYDTVSVPEERLTQVEAFDWETMSDTEEPKTVEEVISVPVDTMDTEAVVPTRSKATRLQSVAIDKGEEGIRITVIADGEIRDYRSFTLNQPARIVFDLFQLRSPYRRVEVLDVDSKWVKRVRHYGHPDKVRIVVDTAEAYLSSYAAEPLSHGLEIVVGRIAATLKAKEIAALPTTPVGIAETPGEPMPPSEMPALGKTMEEEVLSLTLEQCRAMVLQNNLDLKVQWFNPKIAEKAVAAARAVFEPLVFSSFSFYKSETPTVDIVAASSSESEGWDVGVSMPLSTGGQISVNMPSSRTENVSTLQTYESYSNNLTVSLNQPLLRHGGLRTNTHSIRIARYNSLASRARIKLETMNALALVDRVYWRLYAARQELLVRKQEYDLAVAQLERAKRLVKAQTVAQIEILRAESAATQRLEGIILAENSVRNRQRDLKRILNKTGLEMDTPVILVPVVELNPVYVPLDKKLVLDYALKNRMELLELELQIAGQASTVDLERNRRLPSLALRYSYGINGLGDSGSEAFDMVLNNDFASHSVGLNLQIPIGNKAAKSRLHQAILRKRQGLLTKKQRELAITQEVLGSIDQLNANWQRVVASGKSAQLAEQTLLAEQRQFELGLQTSNEVLSAQTSFANARSGELRAQVEYQIAQIDLAYAAGCLLDAARVQWEDDGDSE